MQNELLAVSHELPPVLPDAVTAAGHQLAAVLYHLGYIAVETDEPSAGERLLEEALRAAPALGPATVITSLGALNQLGLLWSRRGEHNRSQHYLQTAETLYMQYKEQVTLKVRGWTQMLGWPYDTRCGRVAIMVFSCLHW